jgi:ABC-type dipeptide/oligopeptide/nickel transport system permease subunit
MTGRGSRLVGLVVVVWLVIGVIAAAQRGYFGDKRDVNCKTTSDTVLTVVAGPLNYLGVNPKVDCKVPEPSK